MPVNTELLKQSGLNIAPGKVQFSPHIQLPLDRLTLSHETHTLRGAGIPSYEIGFFARDGLITDGELLEDAKGLRSNLEFCAAIQGTKKDSQTGEEPGEIFHEFNLAALGGVSLDGRPGNTLYNASDTTALFLRGHEQYINLTLDKSLLERQRPNIIAATEYILRHLDDNGLFLVDPRYSDAQSYALRVTYWKDSMLKGRAGGEPLYPVIYPLAHIQNMAGLRSASRLLESQELENEASQMKKALNHLFDHDNNALFIALDRGGKIDGISSDVLHALLYLDEGDIEDEVLTRFIKSASCLETDLGYRALSAASAQEVEDPYHAKTVWTHEQAIIHKGALKHLEFVEKKGNYGLAEELKKVVSVSQRVYDNYLKDHDESFPELFLISEDKSMVLGGNDPQQWAVGARHYFDNHAMDLVV